MPRASHAAPVLALALLAILVTLTPARAQLLEPANRGSFDGRTFAQVDLPSQPQPYELTLSADRAWAWRDQSVERLFLDRDVDVTLGPYRFRAAKAVVWLEPVRSGAVDAEQLAIYFQDVSDPAGDAALSQSGPRLLVTAVIRAQSPRLRADRLERLRPDLPFLDEAERRLASLLIDLSADAARRGVTRPGDIDPLTLDDRPPLPPAERPPPAAPQTGLISFYAPSIELAEGPDERAAILTGGVVFQYTALASRSEPGRTLQLAARRAVVFLDPASNTDLASVRAEDVRGVYLEGDVNATDGRYTLRGSRAFYTLRDNRAVLLDAVFWTYDQERGMPLYVRAASIRQESLTQWTAKKVTLANVGFAEPHFSIGATDVTLTRAPRSRPHGAEHATAAGAASGAAADPDQTFVDARGVSFRAGDVPFAGLPGVRGELRPTPLRRLSFDTEDGAPIIRSRWDLYTLLGQDAAPGNSASLLLDAYTERGVGVGADLDWRAQDINGSLLTYYINDDGTDQLPSGSEINHSNDNRGLVLAEQVWQLSERWTLFLEAAYISDETFVPAFFRSEGQTRREFANSIYARRIDDNSLFSLEARAAFNDFTSNEYLLQSLGYQTERLPEATYARVADPLFDGLLSYSSETRVGRVELNFTEPSVDELGFRSPRESLAAFGLQPTDRLSDRLRARGLTEKPVARFDSRHELEAPLRSGPLTVVPFVAGRVTAYDDNFNEFNADDAEPYRLWGSAGVRLGTSLQRVDDAVESEILDLHRIRHIIEPSATLWHSSATRNQNDLPIYDDDVESLATGTSVRAGVRNTFQTQRGGPGRWRSVDWLTVNTDYIWSSDSTDRESPLGRFIEARPELSNLGEFINNDAVLQLTDAVAITSSVLVDLDRRQAARTTAGAVFDHGQGFSTFAEFRYLDIPRSSLIDLGAHYELTRKYALSVVGVVDLDRDKFQSVDTRLERRFPQWTVDFSFGVDTITSDVSFGLALRPAGFTGGERTRILTRDVADAPVLRRLQPERERLEFGPFAPREP